MWTGRMSISRLGTRSRLRLFRFPRLMNPNIDVPRDANLTTQPPLQLVTLPHDLGLPPRTPNDCRDGRNDDRSSKSAAPNADGVDRTTKHASIRLTPPVTSAAQQAVGQAGKT